MENARCKTFEVPKNEAYVKGARLKVCGKKTSGYSISFTFSPFGPESFDPEPLGLELVAERLMTEGLTAEGLPPLTFCVRRSDEG